jgi:glycerol-3-phosphate acyltransferase PlsY
LEPAGALTTIRGVEFVGLFMVMVLGYLVGSVPTGYLVARVRGLDIREVGSGNIGATNVFRILGAPAGSLVLLIDAFKGWLACGVLARLVHGFVSPVGGTLVPESLCLAAGIAAVLGHNYTCWLRFRGGKGIATSAGVLIALVPVALLLVLGAWLITFAAARIVSLASMVAALVLPLAVWATGGSLTLILVTTGLSLLALYRHRANLRRILNGTEPRFGRRTTPP